MTTNKTPKDALNANPYYLNADSDFTILDKFEKRHAKTMHKLTNNEIEAVRFSILEIARLI